MSSADTQQFQPTVIECDGDTFDVIATLGQGGMGVVYKAHQRSLDRMVALKVLHKSQFLDPNTGARLRREAQTAAQLAHPNVVRVHSIGVAKDMPFIVMEYVDGRGLDSILSEQTKLSIDQFWEIFLPLTNALQAIHDLGMVHRDIKPSNILVTTSGAPKLMDFGIAKNLNQVDQQKMTQTGAMVGSPWYMSPEQCSGGSLDARSDIYSFGCTMYQALCGEPPFAGDNPLEVMFAHLHEQARTLSGVDPRLSDVVARCLGKASEDRFQNAVELKEALIACRSGNYVRSRHKRRKPLNREAKHLRVLASGALIVFGCLLAIITYQRNHKPPEPEQKAEDTATSRGAVSITQWAEDELLQIQEAVNAGRITRTQSASECMRVAQKLDYGIKKAMEEKQPKSVLANLFHQRALAIQNSGRVAEAEKAWIESVRATEEAYANNDNFDTRLRTKRLNEYNSALGFMTAFQRIEHFNELYDPALKLAQQNIKESPQAIEAVARLLGCKGDYFYDKGDWKNAELAQRQAIELLHNAAEPLDWTYTEAQAFLNLVVNLHRQGNWKEAIAEATRGLQQTQRDTYIGGVQKVRADIAGKAADLATQHLRDAKLAEKFWQIQQQEDDERGATSIERAQHIGGHASRQFVLNNYPAAIGLGEQARKLYGSALLTEPTGLSQLAFLSRLYYLTGQPEKEAEAAEIALEPALRVSPVVALMLAGNATSANYYLKNYDKAISFAKRATEIKNTLTRLEVPNDSAFEIERYWGLSCDQLGQKQEANAHMERCRAICQKAPNEVNPRLYAEFRKEYERITGKKI